MIEYVLVVVQHGKPVCVTRETKRLMMFLRLYEKHEIEDLLYKLEVHFEIPFKDVTIFKVAWYDSVYPTW